MAGRGARPAAARVAGWGERHAGLAGAWRRAGPARGAGGGDAGLAGASGGRARVPAARGRIWGKRERKEE